MNTNANAAPTAPIDRSKGKWYVLHTLSGKENKVKETIESKIRIADKAPVYEVLIPIEKVVERKNGKPITQNRKIFPGYVYVRMDLYFEDGTLKEDAWYFVRETKGVISFVGGDQDHPIALSDAEVEDLLRQNEAVSQQGPATIKVPSYVFVGGTVRILDGPFANFEGLIEEIDAEKGKLKLMVSIFGRSTPVELEFWQVGPDEE